MQKTNKPKIVVILGPTSTGKTRLAVDLAKKFKGEIISADSRQVYRELNIGSGKDLEEYEEIKYHLIDVCSLDNYFTVYDFQKQAYKKIEEIKKRKKLPFVVGGTGLYLQSITSGYVFSKAKVNLELREKLEKLSNQARINRLKELISQKELAKIDLDNPRRVIRAIEINLEKSKTKKTFNQEQTDKKKPQFDCLILGLAYPIDKIREKIKKRHEKMLNQGLIEEVKDLLKQGYSKKRIDDLGLEYRYVLKYLNQELDFKVMQEQMNLKVGQFAKKQMTWFKRDKRIVWLDKNQEKEADKLIENFIFL
jgi:tRNA dimethylallyltransferase